MNLRNGIILFVIVWRSPGEQAESDQGKRKTTLRPSGPEDPPPSRGVSSSSSESRDVKNRKKVFAPHFIPEDPG